MAKLKFEFEIEDIFFLKELNEANIVEFLSEKYLNQKIYDFLLGKILINMKPDSKSKKKLRIGESKKNFNFIVKTSTLKVHKENTFAKDNDFLFDMLIIYGFNHLG